MSDGLLATDNEHGRRRIRRQVARPPRCPPLRHLLYLHHVKTSRLRQRPSASRPRQQCITTPTESSSRSSHDSFSHNCCTLTRPSPTTQLSSPAHLPVPNSHPTMNGLQCQISLPIRLKLHAPNRRERRGDEHREELARFRGPVVPCVVAFVSASSHGTTLGGAD